MKTLNYIGLAAAVVLGLSSCNMDLVPTSFIPEDEYYQNDSEVNTGIIGCYNALHQVMEFEWLLTELRTDNTRVTSTGSTSTTTRDMEQLDQGTISTSSTYVDKYWNAAFAAIYRCNSVIVNINNVEDEELKAQYKGELLFLRSHLYFNLVRMWGPIFLMEKPMSSEEAFAAQRSSEAEVYAMIERDLEEIVDNDLLPEKMSSKDLGRADMLAAKSLLAKVYMTHYDLSTEQYAKAIVLLREVAEARGGQSANMVAYDQVFSVNNEMNDEIIFTVRYKSGNLGLGSPFGNLFAPTNSGSSVINGDGNSRNYCTDDMYVTYPEGDLRRDVAVAASWTNNVTGVVTEARYLKKFLAPVETDEDGDSDWPIIRLADVMLLLAEGINETAGPTSEAFAYLNLVRNRAGLASYTTAELPDRFKFREAVRLERRLELAFENQRFFDIMRWGIAADVISNHLDTELHYDEYDSYEVKPIDEWQVRLPIPMNVINTNPGIAQNVGY